MNYQKARGRSIAYVKSLRNGAFPDGCRVEGYGSSPFASGILSLSFLLLIAGP